ncbi:MAG: hypothetical protein Q4E12_08175 [Coriobacteriia bacterium]|nr:hypothetical protein [Coriobacteriia bacterium]
MDILVGLLHLVATLLEVALAIKEISDELAPGPRLRRKLKNRKH